MATCITIWFSSKCSVYPAYTYPSPIFILYFQWVTNVAQTTEKNPYGINLFHFLLNISLLRSCWLRLLKNTAALKLCFHP